MFKQTKEIATEGKTNDLKAILLDIHCISLVRLFMRAEINDLIVN